MPNNEILCIFCNSDMQYEKFRIDYHLLAWADDPEDPQSMNKLAKAAHDGCFRRFLELNFEEAKFKLLDIIERGSSDGKKI